MIRAVAGVADVENVAVRCGAVADKLGIEIQTETERQRERETGTKREREPRREKVGSEGPQSWPSDPTFQLPFLLGYQA
jgi:hypothetical protein